MATIFETTTPNGKMLRLTNEGWDHICTVHPELKKELNKMKQAMKTPDLIKQGNRADTLMLYKFFSKTIVSPKHLVLVIKYFNTEGFVITGYFTERIRKGEILWKRQ
jgi:hypothetical protein